MTDRASDESSEGSAPAGSAREIAAGARAQAERERQDLLRSIVEYMGRERVMMQRLAEQSALLELAPDPTTSARSWTRPGGLRA